MSKKSVLTIFFTLIVLLSAFNAYAQKSKQRYEMLRLIRHEKFDLILPGALRDNNVDKWIHVVDSGKKDTLALDWATLARVLFDKPAAEGVTVHALTTGDYGVSVAGEDPKRFTPDEFKALFVEYGSPVVVH